MADSTEDLLDKRAVLLAVGVVGLVFAGVILVTVGLFREDSSDPLGVSSHSPSQDQQKAAPLQLIKFDVQPSARFGTARTMPSIVPGVTWKEVPLTGDGPAGGGKLWVYLPADQHETRSLGCILIGPAGSQLVHGMQLSEGDQAEHYPYAQHGFAVVAFEIDGPLPSENPWDAEYRKAYAKFIASAAGVANARAALKYAKTEMPEVDPDRIYVAGHSSAGTTALLCAEHVDGLAGCIAYAPCSDLEGFLADVVGDIDEVLPNVRQYASEGSPLKQLEQLKCPVWLFHAIDDRTVRLEESRRFVARAKAAGHEITLEPAKRGGHYDAMIDEGIDKAIGWMQREDSQETPLVEAERDVPAPVAQASRRPAPGFQSPPVSSQPAGSSRGRIRAYVYLKIISYPSSGNAENMARSALRSLIWAEPDSIRIDRSANELVIGVRIVSLNTNAAKQRLEDVGFVIGGTRFQPVH